MAESLVKLRHGLLRLHKALLDWERGHYERAHGRQSNTELLNAFLEHRQFAWLRPMSQLIVRIDEMLEEEEPPDTADMQAVVAEIKVLTAANESANDYARRYRTALQEAPDAIFAHRDLIGLLDPKP